MTEEKIRKTKSGIEYILEHKKIKNYYIRIKEGRVYISAPLRSSIKQAEEVIEKKSGWIEKHLNVNRSDNKKGNSDVILGKAFKKETVKADFNGVVLKTDNIVIHCIDTGRAEEVYLKWKIELAKSIFAKTVADLLPEFKAYNLKMPDIIVKDIKSAWGKCAYTKNRITFALMLISKDAELIRLVAAHELCHFVYHDHQKGFHELLSSVIPNDKELKKKLRDVSG